MKTKWKILIGVGIVFVIGMLAAAALPILATKTNCGGNSYALTVCFNFAVAAQIALEDNNSQFDISKVDKQALSALARENWGVTGSDFIVKTNFVLPNKTNHEIVVLCTKQFDNVPRPTIWNFYHKNPAHAVGYSDGKTGLISPSEFTDLNLSGFVSMASLATNSEFNLLKK